MQKGIDESTLSPKERLGLAYCRINSWQWDDLFGEKPENFDDLPDIRPVKLIGRIRNKKWRKYRRCKQDYCKPIIVVMDQVFAKEEKLCYWWRFGLGRPKEEFERWYFTDYVRNEIENEKRIGCPVAADSPPGGFTFWPF